MRIPTFMSHLDRTFPPTPLEICTVSRSRTYLVLRLSFPQMVCSCFRFWNFWKTCFPSSRFGRSVLTPTFHSTNGSRFSIFPSLFPTDPRAWYLVSHLDEPAVRRRLVLHTSMQRCQAHRLVIVHRGSFPTSTPDRRIFSPRAEGRMSKDARDRERARAGHVDATWQTLRASEGDVHRRTARAKATPKTSHVAPGALDCVSRASTTCSFDLHGHVRRGWTTTTSKNKRGRWRRCLRHATLARPWMRRSRDVDGVRGRCKSGVDGKRGEKRVLKPSKKTRSVRKRHVARARDLLHVDARVGRASCACTSGW